MNPEKPKDESSSNESQWKPDKHEAPTVEIDKVDLEKAMSLFKQEIKEANSFDDLREVFLKRGQYDGIIESLNKIENHLKDIFIEAGFFKRNMSEINKSRNNSLRGIVKKEFKGLNLFDSSLSEALRHKAGDLFMADNSYYNKYKNTEK
ncbi:MAG: hypothetical protein FJZ43_02090 [Candidatus Staskawiczbacteria bacterium]|nr:hypothetical protein [Candidatus Staskawiczbacteria bacterium]